MRHSAMLMVRQMKEEGLVMNSLHGALRRAQQTLKSHLEKLLNAQEFSSIWWLRARFGGDEEIYIFQF